jgi:hypothetical protein
VALPTDYTFGDKGNPARVPPSGPVALGSGLDANFAACAPLINSANYPAGQPAALQFAAVATSSGAADDRLQNVNFTLVSNSQLLALAQALIASGAAATAGFLLS